MLLINLQGNFSGDYPRNDKVVNDFLIIFNAAPGSLYYNLFLDLISNLLSRYEDSRFDVLNNGNMFSVLGGGLTSDGFLYIVRFFSLCRCYFSITWQPCYGMLSDNSDNGNCLTY